MYSNAAPVTVKQKAQDNRCVLLGKQLCAVRETNMYSDGGETGVSCKRLSVDQTVCGHFKKTTTLLWLIF